MAIIATGLMVSEAIEAGQILKSQGINARVINLPTIKPLDKELLLDTAKECEKIITCEEHSIIGGLGDAVSGYLSQINPVIVRKIGVNDEFGHSGPAKDLLEQFGLCADNIVKVVKEVL
ncbi:1-deoxy-D-xylulose-5-phosphate synthase [bioreactor metagenome]|uniref:1-deoxy-D-xylulose-5-phosphate synthase n=1 Tax=bioreactor metagenome TaxID=1076179 RepID=A0A645AJZ9_9ZZZZ